MLKFGIIAGKNEGKITNVTIGMNIIETSKDAISYVGGITARCMTTNDSSEISNITINENILMQGSAWGFLVGGIVGKVEGNCQIKNIVINKPINLNFTNSGFSAQIGGIVGGINGNVKTIIDKIKINDNINIELSNSVFMECLGGIVGSVEGNEKNNTKPTVEISNILMNENLGNISIKKNGKAYLIDARNLTEEQLEAYRNILHSNGGIIGYNQISDVSIENCIINESIEIGTIFEKLIDSNTKEEINEFIELKNQVGGIIGCTLSKVNISKCYSNVKIEKINSTDTIGGIIGRNNSNGSVISNCAYVNELSNIEIAGKERPEGYKDKIYVGGIIGIQNGEGVTIENSYMNGKIPNDTISGAIIGNFLSTSGTVNLDVLYNKAYRWLGYTSTIGTGVTLNYSSIAKETSDLNTLCDELKKEIEARIDGNLAYKYAKIKLMRTRDDSSKIIQLMEWSFLDGTQTYYYIGDSISEVDNRNGFNEKEQIGEIIDNSYGTGSNYTPDSDGSANKYCFTDFNIDKPIELIIEFSSPIHLSQYTEYTYYTANDQSGRDPITWEISFRNDENDDWIVFDYRENQLITTDRHTSAGRWDF